MISFSRTINVLSMAIFTLSSVRKEFSWLISWTFQNMLIMIYRFFFRTCYGKYWLGSSFNSSWRHLTLFESIPCIFHSICEQFHVILNSGLVRQTAKYSPNVCQNLFQRMCFVFWSMYSSEMLTLISEECRLNVQYIVTIIYV